jgi:hypothetical protein
MAKPPIALQLFPVRGECSKDGLGFEIPGRSLAALRQMGR